MTFQPQTSEFVFRVEQAVRLPKDTVTSVHLQAGIQNGTQMDF